VEGVVGNARVDVHAAPVVALAVGGNLVLGHLPGLPVCAEDRGVVRLDFELTKRDGSGAVVRIDFKTVKGRM
jgi:hypothetical protein